MTDSEKYKPKTIKKVNTNSLTQTIINYLNLNGFNVWRQNNNAVFDPKIKKFRKNSSTKGIPDIIGYQKKTARFIAVEVKTGNDRLSDEQKLFLGKLDDNGGIVIVAKDFDSFVKDFDLITNAF